MSTAMLDQLFVERFREPNTPYLSPMRVGEFFGFRVQELAERAHVHRNTPTARPQAPQLMMGSGLSAVRLSREDKIYLAACPVQQGVFLIAGHQEDE